MRKVILALAVMLLAASSAHATMMVYADQVGGNVVFTLSGNLNTDSLGQRFTVTIQTPTDFLVPNYVSGVPPLVETAFEFGTPGSAPVVVNGGALPNLTGPSSFGFGGIGRSVDQPSNNTGSFFEFINTLGVGSLSFPPSYFSGSPLSASMSFTGTFSSLRLTPGTYEWNWFNSSTNAHDSLVLEIGSVPETGSTAMLMAMALAGLGWVRRKMVARPSSR